MRHFTKNLTLSLLSAAAIFSSAAQASVIANDVSGLGAKPSASYINWDFNTSGGAALLGFELAGFKSLDGLTPISFTYG